MDKQIDELSIRRDEIDNKVRQIGRVMVDYCSELLFPRNIAKYIESNSAFTDDEILELMRAIDGKFVERFGERFENLYEIDGAEQGTLGKWARR